MSTTAERLRAITLQEDQLKADRLQAVGARRAELGEIGERLDVLRYSDEALAGALSALVGTTLENVKELEKTGATFLKKRRGRQPKAEANGAGGAGNQT